MAKSASHSSAVARSAEDQETVQWTVSTTCATSLYYSWSKAFLEAGKKRLAGDPTRQATAPEVRELRSGSAALKEAVADLMLENRLLKKSMLGDGDDDA